MNERPEYLPELDQVRLREINEELRSESSISFGSARAHESMWMLYMAAVEPHRNGSLALNQPLPRSPLPKIEPQDRGPAIIRGESQDAVNHTIAEVMQLLLERGYQITAPGGEPLRAKADEVGQQGVVDLLMARVVDELISRAMTTDDPNAISLDSKRAIGALETEIFEGIMGAKPLRRRKSEPADRLPPTLRDWPDRTPLREWLDKIPVATGVEIQTNEDDGTPVFATKTETGWEVRPR